MGDDLGVSDAPVSWWRAGAFVNRAIFGLRATPEEKREISAHF